MKKLMMMSLWAALIALTLTGCSSSNDDDDEPTDLTELNRGCYFAAVGKEIVSILYLSKGSAVIFIDGHQLSGNATMTSTTLDITDAKPFIVVSQTSLESFLGQWVYSEKTWEYHFTYTRTSDGLKLKYTDTTVTPAQERTLDMKFDCKEFEYGIYS